jgi:hypothetical protein
MIPLLVKKDRQESAFVRLADYWEKLREGSSNDEI